MRAVDAADATFLQPQLLQQVVELAVLRQIWKTNVDARSHTRAQVGWTSGDVAEVIVVLILPTVVEDILFDVAKTTTPTLEHFFDVASLLHRDHL